MKKILLVSMLAIYFNSDQILCSSLVVNNPENIGSEKAELYTDSKMGAYFFYGALGALLSGKISYDVFWQTNYKQDIGELYQRVTDYIELNNITSLSHKKLYSFFSEQDVHMIVMNEEWIRNAYDSWLKPWNWTETQKDSYQKIELLAMIVLYGPLLALDNDESVLNVITQARKTCCMVSDYPLLHFSKLLDAHISFLYKNPVGDFSDNIRNMIFGLQLQLLHFKMQILSNKEYLDELYNFKTHTLLEQIRMTRNKKGHSARP